ncbi:MAG: hypothetical protein ACR2MP_08265 [Streptosporangiaceae bacterium]
MTHLDTHLPAATRADLGPSRWTRAPARVALRGGTLAATLRDRLRDRLRDDAGYTTETVIVTSLLAAAALAVIAIIVAKVTGAANAIQM